MDFENLIRWKTRHPVIRRTAYRLLRQYELHICRILTPVRRGETDDHAKYIYKNLRGSHPGLFISFMGDKWCALIHTQPHTSLREVSSIETHTDKCI